MLAMPLHGSSMLVCLVLTLATTSPILLNEVLYDPAGSDSGFEFIELLAQGDVATSLAGWELQFVNGSGDDTPRTLWRGSAGVALQPRQRWLIGESALVQRDELAVLGLQNGPDALWLLHEGVRVDALAWGDVPPGLGEGNPAADVSNQSLGRVPDGFDSDDNAFDWAALNPPTPGAPNSFAEWLQPIGLQIDPPWRPTAGMLRARAQLVARGDALRQRAGWEWRVDGRLVARDEVALDRGDTVEIATQFEIGVGAHGIALVVSGASAVPDSLFRSLQIGAGAARLSELLPRPNPGEPEWIELAILQSEFCTGEGYALADASGVTRGWQASAACAPQYLLLSADCAELQLRAALDTDVPCFELEGGWLSLNDHATGDVAADEIRLFNSLGAVIDAVAYGVGVEIPRGRSFERGAGGADAPWFLSPAAPTPGRSNASATAELPSDGLRISPNPYRGAGALLHVVLRAQPGWQEAWAEIRDLRGRLVRGLNAAASGGEFLQWIWDGADQSGRAVEPGAYVVHVQVEPKSAASVVLRQLLAVGVAR